MTDAAFLASQAAAEGRLSTIINGSEIRELISSTATTNLMATKDEGCKTREVLGAQIWGLEKETLKGFATTQYEALKNKCELEAKLAECCCKLEMEHANTRALILAEGNKRCESENANLRMELLLRKCGGSSNGNGQGNGNGNS